MRPQRSYGTKNVSRKRARAALSMLLAGCTNERLAGFTAAGLAASYNVSPAKAEEMLAAARKARAA